MAPKIQAKKLGSVAKVKSSAKKSSAAFIKQVPANDSMIVRFMEEPDEWIGYTEAYDQDLKAYYPLGEGEKAPVGSFGSFRYLVNAFDVSENRVIPLKLTKDMVNRLILKFERFHTLLDRDYELTRTGKGKDDTMYDCSPEPPAKRNMTKHQPLDLMKVLMDAYNFVKDGAEDDEDEDEAEIRRKKTKKTKVVEKKRLRRGGDDDDDDDDDDEPVRKPAKKKSSSKASSTKSATSKRRVVRR